MPVVINEVDVVPAERGSQPAADKEKAGGEQPPSDHEIQRLLEQQASRCERVWAY